MDEQQYKERERQREKRQRRERRKMIFVLFIAVIWEVIIVGASIWGGSNPIIYPMAVLVIFSSAIALLVWFWVKTAKSGA